MWNNKHIKIYQQSAKQWNFRTLHYINLETVLACFDNGINFGDSNK